ncbi:uncharacterized protein LOC110427270 [Herrania umbratica]|uniref:Uncharacterized protein LOC110427270 n=1 Tax=Herrania umbratica TaxID=108875 RepID=A0A6J1BH44_9ROSI|nr:uncharacterized protein LOC110427270 [Herrania umbratica]
MAASTLASGFPKLCYSTPSHCRLHPATKLQDTAKFLVDAKFCSSTTSCQRSFRIRAVDSQAEEENPSLDEPNAGFIPQEDLNYLWKLGAGSVVGAAIIKYGSILFPEITRPNILQALVMISTPVIIAVLLLIKQSRVEQ